MQVHKYLVVSVYPILFNKWLQLGSVIGLRKYNLVRGSRIELGKYDWPEEV